MTNTYTVYKHTSPSGKVYIGITSVEVKRRWQNGTNYKNSPHFYKAILKYGWENISHDILYTNLNKEEAEEKEIELIKEYKSNIHEYGYNTESGGNSKGKASKETREKMSKSKKGCKKYIDPKTGKMHYIKIEDVPYYENLGFYKYRKIRLVYDKFSS